MASRSIDLFSKETNCTCSTIFFSNQQKNKFPRAARFLYFLLLFCITTMLFCRTKTSNFLVTHIFMEELSYVLTQYFVSCVHVRFYFSLPLIFTLVAANISLSHSRFECSCFSSYKIRPLFFSITRSNSFSVIHVSVNIKNNVEKDTTLLLFFLSGGHAISFRCIWVAVPVD